MQGRFDWRHVVWHLTSFLGQWVSPRFRLLFIVNSMIGPFWSANCHSSTSHPKERQQHAAHHVHGVHMSTQFHQCDIFVRRLTVKLPVDRNIWTSSGVVGLVQLILWLDQTRWKILDEATMYSRFYVTWQWDLCGHRQRVYAQQVCHVRSDSLIAQIPFDAKPARTVCYPQQPTANCSLRYCLKRHSGRVICAHWLSDVPCTH